MYFLRSLSIYSKTSMSLFSVCMTSCNETMLSCFSSFMREISRMAVLGVPSSLSRWISLRATSSPVWRLRPLKTWRFGLASLCNGRMIALQSHMSPHLAMDLVSVGYFNSSVTWHTFSSCWKELGCLLSIP